MTENSSCGPQMKMLRVDWDHPGMSRWTKRLAVLFEADFICEHGIGSFPSLVALPQAGHIAHVFFRYIKHLKAVRAKMVLDSPHKDSIGDAGRKCRFRKRQRRVKVIVFDSGLSLGLSKFLIALEASNGKD